MARPNGPGDGARIVAAFRDSVATDAELADRTRLSIQSINAYRHGYRKPAAGNLARLARALNVPVQELMRDES